jgi:hypothetical protein
MTWHDALARKLFDEVVLHDAVLARHHDVSEAHVLLRLLHMRDATSDADHDDRVGGREVVHQHRSVDGCIRIALVPLDESHNVSAAAPRRYLAEQVLVRGAASGRAVRHWRVEHLSHRRVLVRQGRQNPESDASSQADGALNLVRVGHPSSIGCAAGSIVGDSGARESARQECRDGARPSARLGNATAVLERVLTAMFKITRWRHSQASRFSRDSQGSR